MIIIIGAAMLLMYLFGLKGNEDGESSNTLSFLLGAIIVLFMFMTFVMLPMQNKLLKVVILESLNGLVTDVKFNKKKGFSKESFLKLNLVNQEFSQYICQDYYSFNYNDMLIESTTIKAADEIKTDKIKGDKKSKKGKKTIIHYFGRVYIIPYSSEVKYNIYGKKHPSVSRKNLPESVFISAFRQLKNVVFPAPFLPKRPYILPFSKVKSILSSTLFSS